MKLYNDPVLDELRKLNANIEKQLNQYTEFQKYLKLVLRLEAVKSTRQVEEDLLKECR